jgi:hypothetical protein
MAQQRNRRPHAVELHGLNGPSLSLTDLLEIVEDRYEKRSTIVTSQVPVEHWYDMIGNPTIADAVLDGPARAQCIPHRVVRREHAKATFRHRR